MIHPTSLTSITHQDSPSPISSQNSTSGDDNSIYNRNQQQQKKKGIRTSLGRLFTRKPGGIDNKPMHESIHQPISSYQQHYPSPFITRGKFKFILFFLSFNCIEFIFSVICSCR